MSNTPGILGEQNVPRPKASNRTVSGDDLNLSPNNHIEHAPRCGMHGVTLPIRWSAHPLAIEGIMNCATWSGSAGGAAKPGDNCISRSSKWDTPASSANSRTYFACTGLFLSAASGQAKAELGSVPGITCAAYALPSYATRGVPDELNLLETGDWEVILR